jgi:hypothetical protein
MYIPLQDLPKFIQMWIFGLKIYHLATMRPYLVEPEVASRNGFSRVADFRRS